MDAPSYEHEDMQAKEPPPNAVGAAGPLPHPTASRSQAGGSGRHPGGAGAVRAWAVMTTPARIAHQGFFHFSNRWIALRGQQWPTTTTHYTGLHNTAL